LSRWRKWAREGKIMTKGMAVDQAVTAELKELRRITIGDPLPHSLIQR